MCFHELHHDKLLIGWKASLYKQAYLFSSVMKNELWVSLLITVIVNVKRAGFPRLFFIDSIFFFEPLFYILYIIFLISYFRPIFHASYQENIKNYLLRMHVI